jgi:hypothetical protein
MWATLAWRPAAVAADDRADRERPARVQRLRPEETGMSAICPGFRMLSNHTTETPTIGKVTPPSGLWKNKT